MPRFSIVIPTLNRHETLASTLRTCLAQDHDSYEVVVCDNASSPETLRVVSGFERNEIKYIRSEKPLAMSANWELALSHAKGEYVIFIGDDDALMPSALSALDRYIRQLGGEKLLRWERVYYSWPSLTIKEHANHLVIHLAFGSYMLSSIKLFRQFTRYPFDWDRLPMLYNSAVHTDLITSVRRRTGRFFESHIPDVYSGFALGHTAGTFASLGVHLSVNAGSAKSNGANMIASGDTSTIAREFMRQNEDSGLVFHPTVPAIHCLASSMADPHAWAFQHFFSTQAELKPNRKSLIEACIRDVLSNPALKNKKDEYFTRIIDSTQDDSSLKAWTVIAIQRCEDYCEAKDHSNISPDYTLRSGVLRMDASKYGVIDVEGAALLAADLLGSPPEVLSFSDASDIEGYVTIGERLNLARRRIRGVAGGIRAVARGIAKGT
jgi:hypothetical protein